MRRLYLLMILPLIILLAACSSDGSVTPSDSSMAAPDEGIQVWGNFALKFDPATQETEIIYDRASSVHYEITYYLHPPACGGAGCVTATLVGWNAATQIATFNVTITNPTALSPSDIRMIFYNLGGKEIANPDSFTKSYLTTIEPFIAFSKANANRVFPPAGAVTETVQIYWPPMSSFFIFFKVTAYLWLNCQDPYEINTMYQTGTLKPAGGSAKIGCSVLDWQNDVSAVTIDTTPLTGGITNLTNIGGTVWEATISNTVGAGVGKYKCLITASSPNPQNFDLYNYLIIEVSPNGWSTGADGSMQFQPGPCTLDFGVIANNPPGHILITQPDPTGACNQIWNYPWNGMGVMWANLVNLDPTNPLFQPWPVVRLDAANDGAFGWTNENSTTWLQDPVFVAGVNTYCNFDRRPNFVWNPEADDHRHYMIDPQWQLALWAVDCCDTFENYQCAIYVDLGFGLVGFQGIPGAPQGFDYTDADIEFETFFPPGLVGPDDGQCDPGDISGIDCMLGEQPGTMFLFIAQKANLKVEVFMITDMGPGPFDMIVPWLTIPVINMDFGIQAGPIDCELLPGHDMYDPAPNIPILCCLIDNGVWPGPPPGFGGSVWIYDVNGAYVDMIGDNALPAVRNQPAYLDTNDATFSVYVMDTVPVLTKFDYF